jgi:hypothetical protein
MTSPMNTSFARFISGATDAKGSLSGTGRSPHPTAISARIGKNIILPLALANGHP